MKYRFLAALLVLTGCGGASATTSDAGHDATPAVDSGDERDAAAPDPLAAGLESIRAEHGVPALAALEIRDGEVVRTAAVGVRSVLGPELVTVDDRWHLGSCTKAMTAALLAILAEDGTLAWDTTLAQAFPDVTIDPSMREVTLHQLLVHRGGLAEDGAPDAEYAALIDVEGTPREGRAEIARRLLARPAVVTPGTEMRYSNLGYAMVGAAMERATDREWEALITERLFTPLGMTSCGFGPPAVTHADAPSGHAQVGSELVPTPTVDNPETLGPAGTVHCSLRDWARFVDWFMAPPSEGPVALTPASLEVLRTPVGGYAPGWITTTRPWAEGLLFAHAGTNTTFFANVWAIPSQRRALLVATNAGTESAFRATDATIGLLLR